MSKIVVNYPGLAAGEKPMGPAPLSPALDTGSLVFISGQVAIDPMTGKTVGDDIETQTRQTLTNLKSLVEAAGLTMADIVKATVFVTDVANFSRMNTVYREFFSEPYPTRSTIGITLANPDLLVEVEAIALRRS